MASAPSEPFILTPADNIIPRVPILNLLFFPSVPSISAADTINTLKDGLGKTIQALPFLAGTTQDVSTSSVDEQQGRLCVFAPWRPISEIFRVQDLSNDSGFDYASLRAENFPVGKLPAETLMPMSIMANPSERPILLIQANVVKGGIIVGMGTNHNFTDGNGAATVVKVWAAYCRGEDGSRYLTEDVMNRRPLMETDPGIETPSIQDYPEIDFLPAAPPRMDAENAAAPASKDQFVREYARNQGATMPNIETIDNETFFFSNAKLAELKYKTSSIDSAKDTEAPSWISTNDALCSLLALSMHLTSTTTGQNVEGPVPLTFGMAINFRRFCDPPRPPDYIGNAVYVVRFTVVPTLKSLRGLAPPSDAWAMLAEFAYRIRRCINSFDVSRLKGLIALLNDVNIVHDISKIGYCPPAVDGETLIVTSWQKQGSYEYFGQRVGRVERVRVCKFPQPPLIIVAPERKGPFFEGKEEEGLEVMVAMKRGRLEKLKDCPFIKHFASWVGKSCERQERGYQEQRPLVKGAEGSGIRLSGALPFSLGVLFW